MTEVLKKRLRSARCNRFPQKTAELTANHNFKILHNKLKKPFTEYWFWRAAVLSQQKAPRCEHGQKGGSSCFVGLLLHQPAPFTASRHDVMSNSTGESRKKKKNNTNKNQTPTNRQKRSEVTSHSSQAEPCRAPLPSHAARDQPQELTPNHFQLNPSGRHIPYQHTNWGFANGFISDWGRRGKTQPHPLPELHRMQPAWCPVPATSIHQPGFQLNQRRTHKQIRLFIYI